MAARSSWETDSSHYSVNDFYTHSSEHGRGDSVRLTMKPSHLEMIRQLIASRQFAEYKTERDFIRDAIHHRLHFIILEHVRTAESVARINVESITARAQMQQADVERYESMIQAVKKTMAALQGTGDRKALLHALGEFEVEAETLEFPWDVRLLDALAAYKDGTAA